MAFNWSAWQPELIFQRQHYIYGDAHPGGYDLKIRTWPRFFYNAPTPKFHDPTFTRSKLPCWQTNTHTPTNKQTDDAENIQRSLLRYDAG